MPKKDLDRWCKGKVDVEHQPVAVLHPDRLMGQLAKCGFRGKSWVCVHVMWCPKCKRVLRYEWQMTADNCPDHEEENSDG